MTPNCLHLQAYWSLVAWVGPGLLIVKGPQDPQASHLHQTGQRKKRSCLLGGFFFLSKYKMLLRAFPTNLLNKIESQIHIEIFGICEKRCDHCDPQLIPSAALIPLMVYPQDSGVITRTSSGGHYSTHTWTVKPETVINAQQNSLSSKGK